MKRAVLACALFLLAAAAPAQETRHRVRDGETLNGIAHRAGVSPGAIARANGLKKPFAVRTGQVLIIPREADRKGPIPGAVHVVREGETLNGIANRAGVPKGAVIAANGLTPPYVVKTGQKLRIPRQRVHIVAAGETGLGIANRHGVPYAEILTANNLPRDAVLKPGQKLLIPAMIPPAQSEHATAPAARAAPAFAWPLQGRVLSPFDPAAPGGGHRGIDIEASVGQPVKAAKGGQVVFADEEPVRYGKLIVLRHDGGWISAYGHLSSVAVRKGERVGAGETIGHAGSTGDAGQPKLHFELRRGNHPVDPLGQLPQGNP